jgi:hypothetical protein
MGQIKSNEPFVSDEKMILIAQNSGLDAPQNAPHNDDLSDHPSAVHTKTRKLQP